ncbi:MAG: hypothetical protein LBJ58_00925 [Tannerellaceae bacterium]|jgi:hypothetical protein|nr:hypothetical protein [Tannerellaceae bacterium]
MLKETTVYVRKGEKLAEVFKRRGYEEVPPNCIINKTIPGLGLTHCELMSGRNSIIIEPNIAVIKGKSEKYKDVFGVYDGVSSQEIADYLSGPLPAVKKVLITPDNFFRIKGIMEELLINMYENFFLLLDECEKDFPVYEMREDFFLFHNRSFVSSTPVIQSDPLMKEYGFYILNIIPDYEYKHNLNLITTNNIAETLSAQILAMDGPVCIFCHSVETIDSLLCDIPVLRNEACVFQDGETLMQLSQDDSQTNPSYVSSLGAYNLFTSHYYLAVDIELPTPPHVIMVSDLFGSKPSFIDPKTEALQIAGRFRNGISSMTHISNIDAEISYCTPKQARAWLKNAGRIYAGWLRKKDTMLHEGAREILREAIRHSSYARFVDKAGNLNPLSVTKFIDAETVKGLYTNTKLLQEAYAGTDHFNVSHTREVHIFSDKDRFVLNRKLTQEGRNRLLLTRFEQLEVLRKARSSKAQTRYRHLINQMLSTPSDSFLYECFIEHGSNFIRNSGYKENVMRKKINNLLATE